MQSPSDIGIQINMGNGGAPVRLSITNNYFLQNHQRIGIFATATNVGEYFLPNARVDFSENVSFDSYILHQFISPSINISGFSIKLNKFGAVGEYIDLSFSGIMTISNSSTGNLPVAKKLTGIAHVIRDY